MWCVGSQFPGQALTPHSQHWKAQRLNHWTGKEVQGRSIQSQSTELLKSRSCTLMAQAFLVGNELLVSGWMQVKADHPCPWDAYRGSITRFGRWKALDYFVLNISSNSES